MVDMYQTNLAGSEHLYRLASYELLSVRCC